MAELEEPVEFNDLDVLITEQAPAFFGNIPFYVPQSDASYAQALLEFEKQFLYAYFKREIGSETIGTFKMWLMSKFQLIMPYYAELYKINMAGYNMLDTVDMYREINTTGDGSKITDENANNKNTLTLGTRTIVDLDGTNSSFATDGSKTTRGSTNQFSDTPQNGLDPVSNGNYLTNATVFDETEKFDSTSDIKGRNISHQSTERSGTETREDIKTADSSEQTKTNTKTIERWHGKEGGLTYAELVKQAREIVININKMIIDDCADLFIQVF